MILTQELAFLKAKEEFQKMIELAKQAANNGVRIHEVETDLWEGLLKMGRYMLAGYVGTQGTGDLGPTLEYEGQPLNRLEGLFDRRYVSIFGELTIPRTVYGTRLTQKFELIPLDARLGLPESDFSYVLQGWDQSFCVQNSFDASRHNIQRILGLGQTPELVVTLTPMSLAQPQQRFREVYREALDVFRQVLYKFAGWFLTSQVTFVS